MQITTYVPFYIVLIKCISSSSVILCLQTLVILLIFRVFVEKADGLFRTCRDKL